MKIIIGCSRNSSCKIGSELIQLWQGTNYSHVYARWYLSSQERDIVFQAAHGMVHQISLNNFTKTNVIVKEFILELSDEQFKKFSQKCIDLCGIPYSKLQLLQIFISGATNGKVKFVDQKGYICSELMAELLEDFFSIKFDKPKFMLEPVDIVKMLEKNL
jgi:hypothetical protein